MLSFENRLRLPKKNHSRPQLSGLEQYYYSMKKGFMLTKEESQSI